MEVGRIDWGSMTEEEVVNLIMRAAEELPETSIPDVIDKLEDMA